jgi:hypothetical protein
MQTGEDMAREHVFNIRFSAEEWEKVQLLAAYNGSSAAGLFRLMLRREERRMIKREVDRRTIEEAIANDGLIVTKESPLGRMFGLTGDMSLAENLRGGIERADTANR